MLDHKLIVFYHLSQNPNTTKVAEKLFISQPAVSKSIQELERKLDVTLFDRKKGRLYLTEIGKYLYSETKELVSRERKIAFNIDKMKKHFTGTLNIGASTTLAQYVIPSKLAEFIKESNSIKITMISGNTEQIEQDILLGKLQVAFIEGTPTEQGVRYMPFLKDEIVMVSSNESKLPETLDATEFCKQNFIFREKGSGTEHIICKDLKNCGINPDSLNIKMVLGSTEAIKNYLQCDIDSCALLSVYSIRNELASGKLRIIDVKDVDISRIFYIIYKQGQPDPYAQYLIDFFERYKDI